jgi:hypothetical protein
MKVGNRDTAPSPLSGFCEHPRVPDGRPGGQTTQNIVKGSRKIIPKVTL